MKNVTTVMKKEFARFFGDRRMIVMILMPAILIYVLYSFMGSAMSGMFSPDEDYISTAYVVDLPGSLSAAMSTTGLNIKQIQASDVGGIKEKVSNKEAELCVVFPSDFDAQVTAYDAQTSTGYAPNAEIYYNSTDPNSSDAYMKVYSLFDVYEASLANKFDVNRDIADFDLATAEDVSASIISSLMPMLLMLFLYTGCMSLAPESIAGEKERGTLATLLVTPLKRSELAIGKILSLAVLSFLSGLVTALATMLSLPKLMAGAGGMLDASIYSAVDYALLALVILSTILLIVALISIISAFAKTVKEATSAVTPLMILVMLAGISGMFGGGAQRDTIYYIIPLYSSAQSMSGIFSLDYSTLNIALSCLSNLLYACVGGVVLTKMFNNEKVMFSR